MARPGIEPGTPATLIRSSTSELPRPISPVHIAPTTTLVRVPIVLMGYQVISPLFRITSPSTPPQFLLTSRTTGVTCFYPCFILSSSTSAHCKLLDELSLNLSASLYYIGLFHP